jgi:hypothetical protein
MKNKKQIHNLIILDESGSMKSIKDFIINGFNEIVESIQESEKEDPEQQHVISMVSFNSDSTKIHCFMEPCSNLQKIDHNTYCPQSRTPLYDALGFSLNKLNKGIQSQTDKHVLVTIFTDGAENASREYSKSDINSLIEELKQQSWTFTYIGTNHDVEGESSKLGIDNMMVFVKSVSGIKKMFDTEKKARKSYITKIKNNEDVSTNYYDVSDSL